MMDLETILKKLNIKVYLDGADLTLSKNMQIWMLFMVLHQTHH